jgi:hypothetical protein
MVEQRVRSHTPVWGIDFGAVAVWWRLEGGTVRIHRIDDAKALCGIVVASTAGTTKMMQIFILKIA